MILKMKYLSNTHAYMYLLIYLIGFIELPIYTMAALENVDDDNLVQLITKREHIIVLFTKDNCDECNELEIMINNISDRLKDDLNAVIVKSHHSNMVNLYNPTKEPALVFFRHGVPLLYHGHYNEASILQNFFESQEPIVKELSDENFEHLTQAATGATTGDWFVFFYSTDCVTCLRLFAIWESVGAALKHRVNVARIDRLDMGKLTAKRLNIIKSPEFIFLRQGKMYRYRLNVYTPLKLIEFATSEYRKQMQSEIVPPESTFISRLLTNHYEWLTNNQQLFIILIVFGSIVMLVITRLCMKKPTEKAKKTDMNKKSE